MKQPKSASGRFMGAGVAIGALMAAAFTAFRPSASSQCQANIPEPDTARLSHTAPQPHAFGDPAMKEAKLSGAPDWNIRTFRTVSPSPWKPEMAIPSVSGADVHSFPNARGHYTADIDSKGITLRFGDAAAPETTPLALTLKTPPETRGSKPRSVDGRVEISRGDMLTEWYLNTPEGVEQGFTLTAPQEGGPPGKGIRLELELPETWTAVADAGNTSIRFRDQASGTEVRYQNLMAYDAAGKRLPARMEPLTGGGGVALHASDMGAVYPVTIDPLFTVVTIAGLDAGITLTTGDQNPVILGANLVFPLFRPVPSSPAVSQGLWQVSLTGRNEPVQASEILLNDTETMPNGLVQGVLNHRLHFSTDSDHTYILPENASGALYLKESSGGRPFLAVEDGIAWYIRQQEFWKTDGTAAGTVRVRALPLNPHPDALLNNGKLYYTTPVLGGGDKLVFSASGDSFGTLLEGYGITLRSALAIGEKVFFSSNEGLHVTDGTIAGTVKLTDGASMEGSAALAGQVYFRKNGGLWRTDGTVAGTSAVTGAAPVAGPILANKGALYFHGIDGGVTSVYRSDGTEAGTTLLKDYAKIASAGGGGLFYLLATTDSEGEELWVSDGSVTGTSLLKDITPGPVSTAYSSFRHADKHLIFSAGGELWRSDGTPAGTFPLFTREAPAATLTGVTSITPAGSKVFFSAHSKDSGTELWVADPVQGATVQILDINPGTASSNPYQIKAFGDGRVLFLATQAAAGTELWRSDGTEAGTDLVLDLSPFTASSPTELLVNGAMAFFIAPDSSGNMALCRTDGTTAGTAVVRTTGSWQSIPPQQLTVFGTGAAFLAPAEDAGPDDISVWITDGTPAGTVAVAGLTLSFSSSENPPMLISGGGKLFVGGRESGGNHSGLWASVGSPPVWSQVRTGFVYPAFVQDGSAFFTARRDVITEGPGLYGVYKSDGSNSGTAALPVGGKALTLFEGNGKIFVEDTQSVAFGIYSYLSALNPDNPADPAVNFSSIDHDPAFGNPGIPHPFDSLRTTTNYSPVEAGSYEFFTARSAVSGTVQTQLWVSDGSNAGTVPVPGAGPFPTDLTSGGDRLYYLTNSDIHGTQLRMLTLSASLTVTVSPAQGGTVTGGLTGATEPGLKPVTATPAAGYAFSHWEGAAVTEPTAPVTTVNMQGPATVTAVFEKLGSGSVITDWAAAYGLTGPQADPQAAPAGDSVGNLLKYSFNLSPLAPASYLHAPSPSAGLPVITVEHTETGGMLRIEFVRRKSGTIGYTAQTSSDLVNWTSVTAVPVVGSVDADWERVTVSEPIPSASVRTFARVKVKLN